MRIHFTINFLNILLVLERSQQEHSLYAFISMASMVGSKKTALFISTSLCVCCVVVVLFFFVFMEMNFSFLLAHTSFKFPCIVYVILFLFSIPFDWLNERMNANEFLFSFGSHVYFVFLPCTRNEAIIGAYSVILWKKKKKIIYTKPEPIWISSNVCILMKEFQRI